MRNVSVGSTGRAFRQKNNGTDTSNAQGTTKNEMKGTVKSNNPMGGKITTPIIASIKNGSLSPMQAANTASTKTPVICAGHVRPQCSLRPLKYPYSDHATTLCQARPIPKKAKIPVTPTIGAPTRFVYLGGVTKKPRRGPARLSQILCRCGRFSPTRQRWKLRPLPSCLGRQRRSDHLWRGSSRSAERSVCSRPSGEP